MTLLGRDKGAVVGFAAPGWRAGSVPQNVGHGFSHIRRNEFNHLIGNGIAIRDFWLSGIHQIRKYDFYKWRLIRAAKKGHTEP
jgi:hypothetical protein